MLQALLQLLFEEGQHRIVELIGLVDRRTELVVVGRPRHVEGVGHHHLLLDQRRAVLQRRLAGFRRRAQRGFGRGAGGQGALQAEAVLGMQLLEGHQQVVELAAGGGVEEPLAQRGGADRPADAQRGGDLGGAVADQIRQLADLGLAVLREAGLGNDQLGEHLGVAEQLLEHRRLALQRALRRHGLQVRQQGVALAVERLDLLGAADHRDHALQQADQFLLALLDPRLDVAGLGGLADQGIDAHQVAQLVHALAQLEAAAQQVDALQFGAGGNELVVGVANQVEIGNQHRQEEQHADQAELHAKAKTIHQRDGRMQHGLHKMSPVVRIIVMSQWQAGGGNGQPLPLCLPSIAPTPLGADIGNRA
ncbi:hypothetical protein D9M69_392590 [compost metagenome]